MTETPLNATNLSTEVEQAMVVNSIIMIAVRRLLLAWNSGKRPLTDELVELDASCGPYRKLIASTNIAEMIGRLNSQIEAMRAAMLLAEAANCGQHGFPDHMHSVPGTWDGTNQLCEECAKWNAAMGRTS